MQCKLFVHANDYLAACNNFLGFFIFFVKSFMQELTFILVKDFFGFKCMQASVHFFLNLFDWMMKTILWVNGDCMLIPLLSLSIFILCQCVTKDWRLVIFFLSFWKKNSNPFVHGAPKVRSGTTNLSPNFPERLSPRLFGPYLLPRSRMETQAWAVGPPKLSNRPSKPPSISGPTVPGIRVNTIFSVRPYLRWKVSRHTSQNSFLWSRFRAAKLESQNALPHD